MEAKLIKPGERWDDLLVSGLGIIQAEDAFCFSIDAVLLAHFVTLRPGDSVVDLGTGTGVIPLLMSTREEQSRCIGIELQPEVAERAQRSMLLNQMQDKIEIICGDLRHTARLLPGLRVDLVVSNPPYLPVGTGQVSPMDNRAIARHEVHCRLLDVVRAASRLLGTGGRFAMVHRAERLAEIFSCLEMVALQPKRLRLVYPRLGRDANLVLLECVKDAKTGLSVLPPLVIYDGDDYTEEVRAFYWREGE